MKKISINDIKVIKELAKVRNYDEIYKRYGKFVYKLFELERATAEIKYEGGKMSNIFPFSTRKFLYLFKIYTLCLLINYPNELLKYLHEQIKEENIEKIIEYENYVDEYLENSDFSNLTDLEVFIKLMQDEHKSMKYDDPKNDVSGYFRLAMLNGTGVCRNIADDLAYKLNLINPDYNARMVVVNSTFGNWKANEDVMEISDNYKKHHVIYNTKVREETLTILEKAKKEVIKRLIPNHAITLVDIPNEGYTLVLDPTNSGIGVLYCGKIDMFNSQDEKFYITNAYNYFITGYKHGLNTNVKVIKSLFVEQSVDNLNEVYGLDAQNETIKKLERK